MIRLSLYSAWIHRNRMFRTVRAHLKQHFCIFWLNGNLLCLFHPNFRQYKTKINSQLYFMHKINECQTHGVDTWRHTVYFWIFLYCPLVSNNNCFAMMWVISVWVLLSLFKGKLLHVKCIGSDFSLSPERRKPFWQFSCYFKSIFTSWHNYQGKTPISLLFCWHKSINP